MASLTTDSGVLLLTPDLQAAVVSSCGPSPDDSSQDMVTVTAASSVKDEKEMKQEQLDSLESLAPSSDYSGEIRDRFISGGFEVEMQRAWMSFCLL